METKYAPIVLFVYNRKEHTKRVIESLKKNYEAAFSDLIIYSDAAADITDGPKVEAVRCYIKTIIGFRSVKIIEREYNYGIERSEIHAITEVIGNSGRIIVLEDDILVAEQFLLYMNTALDKYENSKEVMSVTGYSYMSDNYFNKDYGFCRLTSPWGWGTWVDRWDQLRTKVCKRDLCYVLLNRRKYDYGYIHTDMFVSQYCKNELTWDTLWYFSSFINGKLNLFPVISMVSNIGMDGSGVHYNDKTKQNEKELVNTLRSMDLPEFIAEDEELVKDIKNQFKSLMYNGKKLVLMRMLRRVVMIYFMGIRELIFGKNDKSINY